LLGDEALPQHFGGKVAGLARAGDNVHAAVEAVAEAPQAAPARPDLLDEARRTAALIGNWEGLVELLGTLCEEIRDAEVEVRMRHVLAVACAEELGRFADAASHLERVRTLAGDTSDVLAALVALSFGGAIGLRRLREGREPE
jgi:uncharacterized protein HemY